MTSLASLLLYVVPICALAAVSPVLFLNASTVAGRDGARGSRQFLTGNAAVLVLIGLPSMGLVGAAGAAFAKRELTSSVVDGVLGAVLVAYGVRQWLNRQKSKAPLTGEEEQHRAAHQRGVLAWGVLSMATNLTSLPLFMSASQRIGTAANVNVVVKIVVWAVCAGIVLTPVWLPTVLEHVSKGRSHVSESTRATIASWSGLASIVACLFGGAVLIVHAAA